MKYQIRIDKPCPANWEEMSQNSPSCKFCQSCQKEVMDFTQKKDDEIIEILSNQSNVCGRFTPKQLQRPYSFPSSSPLPRPKKWTWAWVSIFSGLTFTSFGQPKDKKTLHNTDSTGLQQTYSPEHLTKENARINAKELESLSGKEYVLLGDIAVTPLDKYKLTFIEDYKLEKPAEPIYPNLATNFFPELPLVSKKGDVFQEKSHSEINSTDQLGRIVKRKPKKYTASWFGNKLTQFINWLKEFFLQ